MALNQAVSQSSQFERHGHVSAISSVSHNHDLEEQGREILREGWEKKWLNEKNMSLSPWVVCVSCTESSLRIK